MDLEVLQRFQSNIGPAAYTRWMSRLTEVNHHIRTRGIFKVTNMASNISGVTSDLLTGYSYGEVYDWDLYFENLYLSYYGIHRYCRTNLEEFLRRQLPSGFVARTLLSPRWRQHFKPFLAQVALLGVRQTNDTRWLAGNFYDRLKKYLDYWFWYCDHDRNGLPVWDSADHSGMDNQDRRAGELYSESIEGVDLACYLARELHAMNILAANLDLPSDADDFKNHACILEEKINSIFWDEADGFYYDRNERCGAPVRVKSICGFLPLWLGIVPEQRARRLVEQHLLNPAEFWLSHPVATYSRTEPDYYQQRKGDECNWHGTTWIPTNYMVFQGLRKQGFNQTARDLAYRTFEMALNEETTREYYNGETGSGQGLNPFWGWSTLAYWMPLEYELGYDPTNLENEIKSIASGIPGINMDFIN